MIKLIIFILIVFQQSIFAQGLKLNPQVTVSGISSGGYFAHQFHVINSSYVKGAAIFAAGPIYCAKGSVSLALSRCMEGLYVDGAAEASYLYATSWQYSGLIDPIKNLKDDKVYIFSGLYDETVYQSVTDELVSLYGKFGLKDIKYINNFKAAHTYPTINEGGECDSSSTPFIGSCGYNGALESLKTLYPNKKIKKNVRKAGLIKEISQSKHFTFYDSGFNRPLLKNKAYLYIPNYCKKNTCDLHIAFHGCKQTLDHIGQDFIKKSGLMKAGDQLGVVILFPQAKKDLYGLRNPNGCWDWWGYSGQDYSLRTGQQVRIINSMIQDLLSGK